MFLFDLFDSRSAAKPRSLVRQDGRPDKPVEGDLGLERFTTSPSAMPAEISAAGLATSDLSQ